MTNLLGISGFVLAAISIVSFASSIDQAFKQADKNTKRLVTLALYLLAGAMLFWAMILIYNDVFATSMLVYASEILMAAATIMMLLVFAPASPLVITAAAMGASFLLTLRAVSTPVTAYVQAGLLHFNLQGGLRTIMIGALLVVWLPAMLIAAKRFATGHQFESLLRPSLTLLFVCLVFVTGLFLTARRPEAIIGFFAFIIMLFLAGAFMNVFVGHIEYRKVKKDKKPHAVS